MVDKSRTKCSVRFCWLFLVFLSSSIVTRMKKMHPLGGITLDPCLRINRSEDRPGMKCNETQARLFSSLSSRSPY